MDPKFVGKISQNPPQEIIEIDNDDSSSDDASKNKDESAFARSLGPRTSPEVRELSDIRAEWTNEILITDHDRQSSNRDNVHCPLSDTRYWKNIGWSVLVIQQPHAIRDSYFSVYIGIDHMEEVEVGWRQNLNIMFNIVDAKNNVVNIKGKYF